MDLGRVPPRVWFCLYLGVLPVFALLYIACAPAGFHFPTAALEPSTAAYHQRLAMKLTEAVNDFTPASDSSTLIVTQGWWPERGGARVDDIVVSATHLQGLRLHRRDNIPLELTLAIPISNPAVGSGTIRCTSTLTVAREVLLPELRFRDLPGSLTEHEYDIFTWLPTRLDGLDFNRIRIGLEPPRLDRMVQWLLVRQVMMQGDGYTPAISLPPATRRLLYKYTRAMLGVPSDRWDNAARMLYLSSVTLTTLGYGDIVPLTPAARALTGAEALSGVLLAGLFLNSLARKSELSARDGGGRPSVHPSP
jgi:ion channel